MVALEFVKGFLLFCQVFSRFLGKKTSLGNEAKQPFVV